MTPPRGFRRRIVAGSRASQRRLLTGCPSGVSWMDRTCVDDNQRPCPIARSTGLSPRSTVAPAFFSVALTLLGSSSQPATWPHPLRLPDGGVTFDRVVRHREPPTQNLGSAF